MPFTFFWLWIFLTRQYKLDFKSNLWPFYKNLMLAFLPKLKRRNKEILKIDYNNLIHIFISLFFSNSSQILNELWQNFENICIFVVGIYGYREGFFAFLSIIEYSFSIIYNFIHLLIYFFIIIA